MTDEHDDVRDEDRAALDALGSLPRAPVSDTVRARAWRAFVEGTSARPPRRSERARKILAPLAFAAAFALAFWSGFQPGARWTVTDSVEREAIDIARGCGAPGERLHAGAVRLGPSSELEMQLGHDVRVRLLAGTRAVIPRGPGRLFRRTVSLELLSGEAFGTTGERTLGYAFQLVTPEATARLRGTTFAVFRTDEATCFCLYAGELEVTPRGVERPIALGVGRRVFVYRDGRAPSIEPIDDRERMKLEMMDTAGLVYPLPTHP